MKTLTKIYLITLVLLAYQFSFAQQKLNADDFEKKMQLMPGSQVLDVRTKAEFTANHLSQALNADFNNPKEFAGRTRYLDKNKPVFVYCLGGGRSAKAAELLINQGFTQVFELKGGFNTWRNAGKPYQKTLSKDENPGMLVVDFEKKIKGENKLVLVDFGAKWCPPCRKMAPELEVLATEMKSQFTLLKIDVDENQTLAQAKKVEALPVLQLYKNGKLCWSHEGYLDKASIEAVLRKNL
ncbi:MAG: thioredoxin fold domain-containing protein [Verrucomicrobia bacterium]|nr:thioredoxin fold domain-containing protein [Cytophagales bacterium]